MGKITPELYYTHRTLGKQSLFIMTKYTGNNVNHIEAMIASLGSEYTGNITDGYKLTDRELHLIPSDYLTYSLANGLKVFSEAQIESDFVKKPYLTHRRFWVLAALLSVLAVSLAVFWQVNEVKQRCEPNGNERVVDLFK